MLTPSEIERLERIGALKLTQRLCPGDLARLSKWSERIDLGKPGNRIGSPSHLDWLLAEGFVASTVQLVIGSPARPVRALLFNKTNSTNWSLGWHQDRTIAVQRRLEIPGFETWTVKSGIPHVEPPFELIERMATVRIHLDEVDESNAPLLIAPGSHRLGRIVEADIEQVIERCGTEACLARPGEVWLYRTAILHASRRSTGVMQRRVLQVDFSSSELPSGLAWWAASRQR